MIFQCPWRAALVARRSSRVMEVARELFPLPPYSACFGERHHDLEPHVSRSVQRRRQEKNNWISWSDSAVNSMNAVFGSGSSCGALRPSMAQLASLEHIGAQIRSMGKPDCGAAEALRELCGAQGAPRLYGENTPRAVYQRGCISLPDMGGLVNGADILTGEARDLWCNWRKHLLRPDGRVLDSAAPARPYSDPKLVGNKAEYAHFVAALVDKNLLRLGNYAPHSVGIFSSARRTQRRSA